MTPDPLIHSTDEDASVDPLPPVYTINFNETRTGSGDVDELLNGLTADKLDF